MNKKLISGAQAGKRPVTMLMAALATMATAGIVYAGPVSLTEGSSSTTAVAETTPLVTAPSGAPAADILSETLYEGPIPAGSYTEYAYDVGGAYAFFIQVNSSAFSAEKVTLANFQGAQVSVGYATSLPGVAGSATTSSDIAPNSAEFYSNAGSGVLQFNFNSGLQGTTDWLAIYTNMNSYDTLGTISIQDGQSASAYPIDSFEPSGSAVPEAKSLMFGLAIAFVIGVRVVKRFVPVSFGGGATAATA